MAPSKATASHLTLLADTTLTSLYERERLARLGTQPSAADDSEIRHSLDTLKLGIGQLEKELEDLERQGGSSQEIKQKEDVVIKLQSQVSSLFPDNPILCWGKLLRPQYDRLRAMMDGHVQEEEEEVRPKRGESIRLPDDTDLEAQRLTSRRMLSGYSFFVDPPCFPQQLRVARQCGSRN